MPRGSCKSSNFAHADYKSCGARLSNSDPVGIFSQIFAPLILVVFRLLGCK